MAPDKAKRPCEPLERIKVPKGGRWRDKGQRAEGPRPAAARPGKRASAESPAPGGRLAKGGAGRFARPGPPRQKSPGPFGGRKKKPLLKSAKASPAAGAIRSGSGGGGGAAAGAAAVLKASPRCLRRILSALVVALGSAIVLAVVSALFVGAYLYFSENGYFTIKKFDIRGISRVTRAQILSASGLDQPVSSLSFDTVKAVRSLKSLPWIEDAEISRTPPPDGVTIRVKEYRPRAVVNLGELYFIDGEGRPFKSLEPGENPDFPVVSGFSPDELLNGGPLAKSSVAEVFELMDALRGRADDFSLDNVSEIRWDHDIGVTVFMRGGGLEVRAGFGPYGEKMRRLGRVMEALKESGLTEGLIYLNLECAPRVTARYLRGYSPADKSKLEREAESEGAPEEGPGGSGGYGGADRGV